MKNKLYRFFICVCVCALALAIALPSGAMAEEEEGWKPSGPVNMIVGFAAGGGLDVMARAIAQYIDLDGQTMYVTNIEGASGTIGAMEAYHSDNDGQTLFIYTPEGAIGHYLAGAISVDLCDEMEWIDCLANDSGVLAVAADGPYESLDDVISAAKAAPGSLTIAALGGAATHASVKDVELDAGIELTFVPYDSSAKSRAAVMGGHADMLYCQLSEAKAFADSGELKILAVAAEERIELIPDVPTFKELGIDTINGSSRCIILPPETDEEIIRYYEEKLKEVFDNEDFQATIRDTLGYPTEYVGYDDMKDRIASIREWAEDLIPLVLDK